MSSVIEWQVPPSMIRWLGEAPSDQPVVILLRHSVRNHLPPGDAGKALPITDIGVRLAKDLGARIGGRLRSLHASPLVRCVQTAEALREGAAIDLPMVHDRLLGDPGVFVIDERRAWRNWEDLGHEGVMQHLVAADDALPGMAHPRRAAHFLVHHMLARAAGTPGIHVFVTHDSLVTATAARHLGMLLGPDAWPWYLEGAFFWRDDSRLAVAYRDHVRRDAPGPLCTLDEEDVILFARREVARTVGLDSGARFFLAGGAFKTLLTGRPPRDLDLWAPSAEDRERIVAALDARGAKRLSTGTFADAFEIDDRVVEVPHATEPSTLDERLARFDIGLSAVGAEHLPGDRWTARIHPLAKASVDRRKILLLKPLVNWKYALATLERMRRYAAELGFEVPQAEEDEVWRVFQEQSPEMRTEMLRRFERTAIGGFNVVEEAACRFP
ncbi:histidine phosphatase family protein [Polyangium jinanense]|uniref:histidine phosphatase family protein n=1 Tax=Polyangium jinanense TaxID=2829994 RepID=UPI002340E21C|nr:histidine phosphatase family protein [Polyangium jinanense]MDC3956930.1 histidine phosphatase family protein [Polyangium jinanense]